MSDLNNLFLMEIEGFNVAKDLEEALKITQPQQKAWGSLLKTYNSLCKSKKDQNETYFHHAYSHIQRYVNYNLRDSPGLGITVS